MKKSSKIYLCGHNGMVGSAILRKLKLEEYNNILIESSKNLDLRRQSDVEEYFKLTNLIMSY